MPKDHDLYDVFDRITRWGVNKVKKMDPSSPWVNLESLPQPRPTRTPGRSPAVLEQPQATAPAPEQQMDEGSVGVDAEPVAQAALDPEDPMNWPDPEQPEYSSSVSTSSRQQSPILSPLQLNLLRQSAYNDPFIQEAYGKQQELDGQVDKLKAMKPQLDLTPLMAFVDDQTGSKFTSSYKPPTRPEDLASEVSKQMTQAQASRAKLADMIAEQMKLGVVGSGSGRNSQASLDLKAAFGASRIIEKFKSNSAIQKWHNAYSPAVNAFKIMEEIKRGNKKGEKYSVRLLQELQQVVRSGMTGNAQSTGSEREEVYVKDLDIAWKDLKQRITSNIAADTIDPSSDIFQHIYGLLRREVRRRAEGGNKVIDLARSGNERLFEMLPENMGPMREGFREAVGAARNMFVLPAGAKDAFVIAPDGTRSPTDIRMLNPAQRKVLESKGYKFIEE